MLILGRIIYWTENLGLCSQKSQSWIVACIQKFTVPNFCWWTQFNSLLQDLVTLNSSWWWSIYIGHMRQVNRCSLKLPLQGHFVIGSRFLPERKWVHYNKYLLNSVSGGISYWEGSCMDSFLRQWEQDDTMMSSVCSGWKGVVSFPIVCY